MYYTDKNYVVSFAEEHSYPQQAVKALSGTLETLEKTGYSKNFNTVCEDYMTPDESDRYVALERLKSIADSSGVNEYTLDLLFYVCCSKKLKEKYAIAGIAPKLFFDSMEDLRYKLVECINCEGVPGTFVGEWFHGFYCLKRFALGRFQFEKSTLSDDYSYSGGLIKKGTPCLNFHIPSSGISLTDDVRYDSYRQAYHFDYFSDYVIDGLLVLECNSWLLYDKHREFLPEKSNILRFMNDFDIIRNKEKEGFSDGWRVFNKDSDLPYDQLPDDTSLRRAYKNWLIKTGKAGSGYGIIVFDGEKIVNKK